MSEIFVDKIEELLDKLYRFLFRITGNHDDALDFVQETFRKTYTLWNKTNDTLPNSYFFKTAYNTALNEQRNRNTRLVLENELKELNVNHTVITPQTLLEQTESNLEVQTALKSLSERQREVITYRFFINLTIAEIAEAMSISDGSVKVHLARGLQNLKNYFLNKERI